MMVHVHDALSTNRAVVASGRLYVLTALTVLVLKKVHSEEIRRISHRVVHIVHFNLGNWLKRSFFVNFTVA